MTDPSPHSELDTRLGEAIVAHLYGDEADAKFLRKFGPDTGN